MKFWGTKHSAIILGAGPAGLLAAHAAERRGWEVQVITMPDLAGNPKKSELHGCQYLHAYIPNAGIPASGKSVGYNLVGTSDGYRRKVYGSNWSGEVSPDEYGPERDHQAWDLRKVYDELWSRWEPRINCVNLSPSLVQAMNGKRSGLTGVIFSTIPADRLCLRPAEHKFLTQDVWAMGSTRDDFATQRTLPYYAPENTVQCNGSDGTAWYRAATVFGASTIEWPAGRKPPINGIVPVRKPLSTDCDCHVSASNRYVRLGRYGKWQKGVLVHTAYEEMMDL